MSYYIVCAIHSEQILQAARRQRAPHVRAPPDSAAWEVVGKYIRRPPRERAEATEPLGSGCRFLVAG